MKQVILIGDSIRIGYQAVVAAELAGVAEVWGPEDNGRDSRHVLERLDDWVTARQPDVLHINCGLHDLKVEFGSTDRAVPLDEYMLNVTRILETVRAQTQTQVIWATTTPVNKIWHRQAKDFDRFEADVLAYNAAALAICQRLDIPVDDLYGLVMDQGRDHLLVQDGVHYGPDGCILLGRAVATKIRLYI